MEIQHKRDRRTPAGDDAERAAFESWMIHVEGSRFASRFDRVTAGIFAGDYRDGQVQGAWNVWQARAALAQSERVAEWIPVSERLPADSRDVLVYCSDTDEHMVGSSMGCGRFAFAFSERGTRICCKPSHWRYIEDNDKPATLSTQQPSQGEGGQDE